MPMNACRRKRGAAQAPATVVESRMVDLDIEAGAGDDSMPNTSGRNTGTVTG